MGKQRGRSVTPRVCGPGVVEDHAHRRPRSPGPDYRSVHAAFADRSQAETARPDRRSQSIIHARRHMVAGASKKTGGSKTSVFLHGFNTLTSPGQDGEGRVRGTIPPAVLGLATEAPYSGWFGSRLIFAAGGYRTIKGKAHGPWQHRTGYRRA